MTDLSGETLCNNYYLRRLVGSGGMADVYEAWDQNKVTRMAVKILRRDLARNAKFVDQFKREAEILQKLSHPNITRLYEFINAGSDIVFIVMEWVDGLNLREALIKKGRPFSPAEVEIVLEPVCVALNYAHKSKIFHCDVKTPNILLPSDGRVLLTDFGVARYSNTRVYGGTQYYMAPEQFNDGGVDARADIYSLGVTIFELFSGGMLPFRGESPDSQGSTTREKVAWEHHHLNIPPLSRINPSISPAMERIVSKAMSKNPRDRYGSTFDLLDDFRNAGKNLGDDLNTRFDPAPPTTPTVPVPVAPPPPVEKFVRNTSGPYLLAREGQYANEEISIPKNGLTLGRSHEAQVVLHNKSVSRRHAHIIRGKRGICIEDEGSKYGTYVNNDKIDGPYLLKDGDIIQIGYGEIFELKL